MTKLINYNRYSEPFNDGKYWIEDDMEHETITSFTAGIILNKIKFRYDSKIEAWDDRWIAYDAYKKGFEVFLDTTVKCKHLYLNRPFSYKDFKEQGAY